jgi:DNA-binding CsgD family transcriptional regulator
MPRDRAKIGTRSQIKKRTDKEIILLCAQGLPTDGIARKLGVHYNSIIGDLCRLYAAYDTGTKVTLVFAALKKGVVTLEEIYEAATRTDDMGLDLGQDTTAPQGRGQYQAAN